MINTTIRPLSQINGYDSRWGWDKEENANESRFAKRFRRANDERRDERESNAVLTFNNPAFNILTGKTNLTVSEIASEIDKH